MARYFLNEFQRQKLESYPEFLLKEDMHKFFTLTIRDKEFIKDCRGDANKIGNAIQICTIKFIGFVPLNFFEISKNFVKYVAKQLNLDWNDFYNYAQREQTRTEHLNKILIHLNFKHYDVEYEKKLQAWLNGLL